LRLIQVILLITVPRVKMSSTTSFDGEGRGSRSGASKVKTQFAATMAGDLVRRLKTAGNYNNSEQGISP
jgi:hypothetical protein